MTDDAWMPSPEELERLRKIGSVNEGDRRFIQTFAAVAHAIDGCTDAGEAVTLLLSTCRNEYLTVNAIFADLKLSLSNGPARDSLFERSIAALRPQGSLEAWKRVSSELGLLMNQARMKRSIWEDRERLLALYEESAQSLRGTMRQDALNVLGSSPALQHESGQVWPAHYTRVSRQIHHCGDQLETLRVLTERCSAAYTLLARLAALDVPGEPARAQEAAAAPATLFDNADTATPPASTVAWGTVIEEIRKRPTTWHVRDHPGGGVVVTLTDLPEPKSGGWPDDQTVRRAVVYDETPLGTESEAQLSGLLDLVQTATASARAKLRSSFRANVAAPPMPEPFLVDLSSQQPQEDMPYRSFNVQYSKLTSDRERADSTRVAALKIAIPEEWHNHEGHYRYNTDIADLDALRDTILAAIEKAFSESIPFLLLPEYFIPRRHLDAIKVEASRRGVNLVGGVEGRVVDGQSVNEAVLLFPEAGTELAQGKQGPSVFEARYTRFVTDGQLQVVRNTPLGNLAVLICSDFLEADVLHRLAVQASHRLHALVVVARNPKPEIFKTLALADAVRLYTNVIIVNSTDGSSDQEGSGGAGGCIMASPHGSGLHGPIERFPLGHLAGTIEEFPEPELIVWDVQVSGVFSRTNRRQNSHWLSPSVFAQQG